MRGRWIEDQNAPRRSIVQVRPGQLDLLQLPQNILAEVADGKFIAGVGRVHSELSVELPPGASQDLLVSVSIDGYSTYRATRFSEPV